MVWTKEFLRTQIPRCYPGYSDSEGLRGAVRRGGREMFLNGSASAALHITLHSDWEGKIHSQIFLKYASDDLTLNLSNLESWGRKHKQVLKYSKSGLLMCNLYKIKVTLLNRTVWWVLIVHTWPQSSYKKFLSPSKILSYSWSPPLTSSFSQVLISPFGFAFS